MPAKLYAVPASHPCATAEAALRRKGIPYERIDLIPSLHWPLQLLRFGGRTVPGVEFEDGEKVLGSRAILRAAEQRAPDPPLFPADPEARRSVERAEEWGEEVLQPIARRLIWVGLSRQPAAMPTYTAGARLPIPPFVAKLTGPLVARVESAVNHASEPEARADLANLDTHLARVDRWIEQGVLGGEEPNAADLQIGAGLALLRTLDDLRPRLDERPAGALAERFFGDYPGRTPAGALPA